MPRKGGREGPKLTKAIGGPGHTQPISSASPEQSSKGAPKKNMIDLVVNNLSEDFNKMVLDVRSKPIKAMMEGLTANLMVKYEGIRENTE